MVLVDDCAEYLPIKEFYDSISMDMTINAKNVASYTLPFEESPKFAFTTNYVPKEFNQSSRQRMLYLVFSDYYHSARGKRLSRDATDKRRFSQGFVFKLIFRRRMGGRCEFYNAVCEILSFPFSCKCKD